MTLATTPVGVPDVLKSLITGREPWRAQVLEDARWWLASWYPNGLGLEVAATPTMAEQPGWSRFASPVEIHYSWVDRMDPFSQQVETAQGRFHAVAEEAGRWVVVAIWSDEERHDWHRQLKMIRERLLQD